jgi:ABC-type transport system involved in multi-copper enzyme maturation permease subunit
MQFAQIGAMARYEFLMHWRRRVLVVATLSLAVICIFAMLISSSATREFGEKLGTTVDYTGINIVSFFGLIVYFVMIALFTPIAADAVPLDHHVGISELIRTLPVKHETYLIGKLVGMFVSILVGVLIAMVLLGVVARVALGAYDLPSYINMWVFAVLPLAFLNPGLCLLVGASQPTRKRAAMVGGLVAILCFVSFTSSVNTSLAGESLTLLDLFNPARPAILRYLMPSAGSITSDLISPVVLTFAVGLLELALIGGATWLWMQRQERRA